MSRLAGNERKYIEEVLSHEFRTSWSGRMVSRLEGVSAEKFGSNHAIALCNGTATLHSILAGAGIGPGDEVIVPALTMASTSLAVLHAGATPVWADVCSDSWCMEPGKLEELINGRTRAVIAVVLYGMPPDMDRLAEICRAHDLVLIEDNAQGVGATYKGRLAGSFGVASSWSFQSSKTLTCGEGGIVLTNDEEYAKRIRMVACLGYDPTSSRNRIQRPNATRHYCLGWNYRMSDLQAAVALGQLEDIEYHVNTRKNAAFAMSQDCEWLLPQTAEYDFKHAYWSLAYRLENAPVTWEQFRERFLAFGGDPFYACWLPTYKEPMFHTWPTGEMEENEMIYPWDQTDGYSDYFNPRCPVAEAIQPNIIAFKTNYDLFDEAQEQDAILQRTIENCEKFPGDITVM